MAEGSPSVRTEPGLTPRMYPRMIASARLGGGGQEPKIIRGVGTVRRLLLAFVSKGLDMEMTALIRTFAEHRKADCIAKYPPELSPIHATRSRSGRACQVSRFEIEDRSSRIQLQKVCISSITSIPLASGSKR